jgi:hypothetical protein
MTYGTVVNVQGSRESTWISTCGTGVFWLHLRSIRLLLAFIFYAFCFLVNMNSWERSRNNKHDTYCSIKFFVQLLFEKFFCTYLKR